MKVHWNKQPVVLGVDILEATWVLGPQALCISSRVDFSSIVYEGSLE